MFARKRKEILLDIAERLGLPEQVKKRALSILKKAEKTVDFSGRSPRNSASSILYLTVIESGIHVVITDFEHACECTGIKSNSDYIKAQSMAR